MKQEYSYGAVVYRIYNGHREYLIEHMRLGHISLPKGHIEPGETPLECTLREIKEETNLDVEVDTGFEHTITYSPHPGAMKEVTFYVAKATSSDIICQPEEVKFCEWLSVIDGLFALTHDTDKETLRQAAKYLDKKYGNG